MIFYFPLTKPTSKAINQCGWAQLISFRSIPSLTISHSGLSSRSRTTDFSSAARNWSTSSSEVNLPMPMRREVWARSSLTPSARSTQEGSRDSLVQADPELTAYCFMAMRRLSPSTKAKDMLMLPQQRWRSSPFSSTWVILERIELMILWQSLSMCRASFTISRLATSHAFPRPTTSGVGSVPDRNPRYCPPPLISGARRTLGLRRRQRAPMPLGPQILWPLMLMRSMFILLTSTSIFPVAWAASVCRKILCSRQSCPICSIFWRTPISLWTRITLTQSTFSLDSAMVFRRSSTSRMPFFSTGRQVTLKPSSSRWRQVSSMHLCQIWVVMMCLRSLPQNLASPFSTMLLDSVAPEVKMISLGSAPISTATCSRAFQMAFAESHPNLWVFEWGLPQKSVRQGIMASRTRQSMGVVAWQSKYCTFPSEKRRRGVPFRREAVRRSRLEICLIVQ